MIGNTINQSTMLDGRSIKSKEDIVSMFLPPKPIDNYQGRNIYLKVVINEKNFEIYNSYKIKDTLKQHGFKFIPDKKCWSGTITQFALVVGNIWEYLDKEIKYYAYVKLGIKNKETENIGITQQEIIEKYNVSKITEDIFSAVSDLRSYQKHAIERIVDAFLKGHKGFILEDEQGLGKTLQAMACIYGLYRAGKAKSVLIFTNKALVENIYAEFIKFLGHTGIMVNVHKRFTPYGISILSYSRLTSKDFLDIKNHSFDILVLDEAQALKNLSSKRVKRMETIVKNSRFIVCMTGTLIKNRPLEAYNITKWLNLHDYSVYKFVKLFEGDSSFYSFKGINSRYYERINPENVKKMKEFLLGTGLYIRRIKKDVLKELPEKTRVLLPILLKGKEQDLIDALRNEEALLKQLNKKVKLSPEEATKISTYRRVIGTYKAESVVEFLESLVDKERLIIYAHHKEVINKLTYLIKQKYKVEVECLYGDTPVSDRQRIVTRFQSDEDERIWLIVSYAVGSEGLTLTKADTMIFAELDWTPNTMLQAEDRIHRISQTRKCTYYYTVAVGTLDQYIYSVIDKKNKYLSML